MKKIILFFVCFFYIFTVTFAYVPLGMHTRLLMGIGGFLIYLSQKLDSFVPPFSLKVNRHMILLFLFSLSVCILSFISILYNGTCDSVYVTFPISILLVLSAGYFVIFFFEKTYGYVSFKLIANYIIGAVVFQMLISTLFFLFPVLKELFTSIIVLDSLEADALALTAGIRLSGFGINFFDAGVLNSCVLILITILLCKEHRKRNLVLYSWAFFLILVVGCMMSRTTLLGGGLAIGILAYKFRNGLLRLPFNIGIICKIFFWLCIIFIGVFTLIPAELFEKYGTMFNFGFEIFINYFKDGEFRTASTDDLLTAYILPDNLKTIIIGDGFYADPFMPDSAYYMGTDVGFLRLIYYFGLMGLVSFLSFYAYSCYIGYLKNKEYKFFFLLFFILIILFNFKGTINLFYIIVLFCLVGNDVKSLPTKNIIDSR